MYTVLTLEAGVEIRVGNNSGIEVGGAGDVGGLTINGTAQDSVRITAQTETPGAWQGIWLNSNNVANQWRHASIGYAGQEELTFRQDNLANVYVGGGIPLTAENCRFHHSAGAGVSYEADASFTDTGNSYDNNAAGDAVQEN